MKNMLVKLEIFPKDRGKHKKCVKPLPSYSTSFLFKKEKGYDMIDSPRRVYSIHMWSFSKLVVPQRSMESKNQVWLGMIRL